MHGRHLALRCKGRTAAKSRIAPWKYVHPAVAAALRAATDVVFLARGGEAPFGEAEETPGGGKNGSVPDALDATHAEVRKLAQARWTTVRTAAAHALSSLADLMMAADYQGSVQQSIANVRLQAERLRLRDDSSFGDAGWIKTGLLSALDALDTVGKERGPAVAVLSYEARRAVVAIEGDESLAFQRTAVQDAMRSTVDAFAMLLESAAECATRDERPSGESS